MAASNASIQPSMPIFEGENFDHWSIKMRTLFMSQGLWEMVESGYQNPADVTSLSTAQQEQLKENRKKDAKALFLIQQESHEQRLLRHEVNPIGSAFQTKLSMGMQNPSKKTQVGPRKRQHNYKKGGRFVKGNSQNQNKGRGKDVICDFCKNSGHAESECWKRAKPQ
ncbi:hypothetical protein MRB53_028722 [Persea americana]|uniref:Uncharacterized protein n=1 Tax=Persea americana TaxID=3435 RepID=A0ACC2KGR4_PERAE|nr:hypothetical protein MRB53_028722 [Persea americana]